MLGILACEFQPPRPLFQEVPNRTAGTLIPIIESMVRPGTIIHTDGWAAYNSLEQKYDHRPVNHSANWVDPATG